MQVDYSPITSSTLYEKEIGTLKTTGKQKQWVIIVMLLIPPLWIPLIIYALVKIPEAGKRHTVRQQALVDFASKNGYTYQAVNFVKKRGENLPPSVPDLPYAVEPVFNAGTMTGLVHDQKFVYNCSSYVLPNYSGVSGQGRNTPETRYICSFSVELSVQLPKLFIDSKRNNIKGFENKPDAFVNMQQYNLEGEFPNFYQVLAEKNDQINVLSILTPEVMQKLLAKNYYDIWLNGNKLVVFAQATEIEYFVGIPEIFSTVDTVLNETDKIARALRANATLPAPTSDAEPSATPPVATQMGVLLNHE